MNPKPPESADTHPSEPITAADTVSAPVAQPALAAVPDALPLPSEAHAPAAADPSAPAAADEAAPAQAQAPAQAPKVPELSPAACAAALAQHFPALFGAGVLLPVKLRIQTDIQQRVPGVFSRKSLSLFLHRHTTSTAYIRALLAAQNRFDLDGQPAGDISEEHRAAAVTEMDRRKAIVQERRAAERLNQRPNQRPQQPTRAPQQAAAPGEATAPGTENPPSAPPQHTPRPDRPPRPAGARPPRPDAQPRRGPGGAEGRGRPDARSPRPARGPRADAPGINGGGFAGGGEPRPWRDRNAAAPTAGAPESPPASSGDPVADAARRERSALLRSFEGSTLTKANFLVLKRMTEADLDAQLAQARQERQPGPPRDDRPPRR